MPLVNIMVNQRAYTIACDDGEEDHLRGLAAMVDAKAREVLGSVGQVGDSRLLLMAALLIADEHHEMTGRLVIVDQEAVAPAEGESAAESLAAEPLEVPPGQAVLHGQYHGVGAEHRIDIAHDLIEEVGLHRQHDDILLAGLGRLVDGFHFGGLDLAVVPLQLESVPLDRGEMRALVDDGDILARECEFGRQQPADRAGADDADLLLLRRGA